MCDLTVTELIHEILRDYNDDNIDWIGQFTTDLKKELLGGHVGTIEFAEAVNILDEAVQSFPSPEIEPDHAPDGLSLYKQKVEAERQEEATHDRNQDS